MSTSGTAVWNPDLTEIVEEAYEQAGLELKTGYDFRTARRSLNMMLADWANKGINLWTLTQASITLVQGTATYNLPTDLVDVFDVVLRQNQGDQTNQVDLTISRISLPTYNAIPNKLTQGRPLQYWVNRQEATPTITLWLIPDGTSYVLVYWYLRRLQDAGTIGNQTLDIPFRFTTAMITGLAYHLALKRPEVEGRIDRLKSLYDDAFELAASEDREKAPLRLVPRMGYGVSGY